VGLGRLEAVCTTTGEPPQPKRGGKGGSDGDSGNGNEGDGGMSGDNNGSVGADGGRKGMSEAGGSGGKGNGDGGMNDESGSGGNGDCGGGGSGGGSERNGSGSEGGKGSRSGGGRSGDGIYGSSGGDEGGSSSSSDDSSGGTGGSSKGGGSSRSGGDGDSGGGDSGGSGFPGADPGRPGGAPVASYRKAGMRARRAWNAAMRAARGNTAAKDEIEVAWWNARVLAAGGDAAAAEKLEWLLATLNDRRPAVVFLFEVLGDYVQFRRLRKRLTSARYSAVFLPGETDGKRDGVVVAVDMKQARMRKTWRVAERTLAAKVTFKGEAADEVIVGTHGVTSAKGTARPITRFKAQLRQGAAVADPAGGLLLGDLNYVPCSSWRRACTPMNSADLALRALTGWRCECCEAPSDGEGGGAYIVGGDAGVMNDELRGWTRYATSEGAWGEPTSRIDVALAFDDTGCWTLGPAETPQRARPGGGARVALSDHLMQFVRRRRRRSHTAARETRKMAPKLGQRGDGPARKQMLSELLEANGEVSRDAAACIMAAQMKGVPATDALIQAVRAATDEVEAALVSERAERKRRAAGPGGDLAGPLRRARMHKARLREIAELRGRGVRANEAAGTAVMHPAAGLRKYVTGVGDGWSLIVYKCRKEYVRARKELAKQEASDARWLVAMATRWAALPEGAVAEKQRLAFAMVKKQRAGATLGYVRKLDVADGELVSTYAPEAAAVLKEIGEINVAKSDDGAVVAACKAWHDKFIGQWAVLRGASGGPWTLRQEVNYKLFRHVVKTMPTKAAGISGVTVAQLKLASEELLRAVYDAVMNDIDAGLVSDRWHKVVYVLLEKPLPNNPEVVGERREIALTEHDVKALLQALRRSCYSRLLGRSRHQNLGWVPGYGCGDVAQASAWMVQQARALRHPIYMLYADLSQFFPRVHRGCLRIAEVAAGLPEPVVRLAAMIYGEHADDPRVAKCVYDSDGGFGGAFANGQGTLMGCPLSTDRARLFLNSIVAAIEMTAKGVRLWGSQTAGRDGGWRRVAQLMCADDWLGTFESVEELRAAWGLWCLWEPITGAKVGIKAADKTVLTGMRFGDNGCVMAVEDPVLTTGDGRVVPVRPPSYAYKHLGQWRRADASDITARKKLRASMGQAVRRVKQMPRSVTRYQALIVSDALVGGLACFYLAGMYITMGEAEKMEASWRAVFNNRTRRARDTPRATLYADTWTAGRTRRHMYAHGLAAVYTAVASALADSEDLEHRAAARAGLDLAMYRMGCRQDPRTWDFTALRSELEASLADSSTPRYLGEAWMLAAILLRSVDDGSQEGVASTAAAKAENWRWATPPAEGAPLSPNARRAAADGQSALAAQLGVALDRRLLSGGYVRCGHFCAKTLGGWQWSTLEQACRCDSELQNTSAMQKAWKAAVEGLKAAGAQPESSERPVSARRAWIDDTRRRSPFDGGDGAQTNVDVVAAAALGRKLQAARRRGPWRVEGHGVAAAAARWRRELDACITAPAPTMNEWQHGVPTEADLASGARTVFELGGATEHHGGQARWETSTDFALDEDGCISGWRERAAGMMDAYDIDEEGYVTRVDVNGSARVEQASLQELPVVIQLIARARWELGDVPVVDEPPTKEYKSNVTRVNLQAARDALRHAIRLQCQYEPTHAAATDGTKATKTSANGEQYTVIARGAVLHDGRRLGGKLTEEDVFLCEQRTTYLAEKAATDDVLATLPAGSRVVLWLDSISPQQALQRFRRSPARRKRQFHMAARHAASARLLANHEVVIYHWQMSHVGEPANEWADREAAARAEAEEILPLEEPLNDFSSAVFPRDAKSTRSWAVRRGDRVVAAVMRAASVHSVYADEHDIRPMRAEPPENTVMPAIRCERCFYSDAGHHWTDAQWARRRLATCPYGCGVPCTWMHFAFECTGGEVRTLQQLWAEKANDLLELAEPLSGHEDLSLCVRWLAALLDWARAQGGGWRGRYVRPAGLAERWDRDMLRQARRVLCGHVASTGSSILDGKRELREAAADMAEAGAALMQTAHEACVHAHAEELRVYELVQRTMLKYVRILQKRVRANGPACASRLREFDSLGHRVRQWLIPGGVGPMHPAAAAWLARLQGTRVRSTQATPPAAWMAGDKAWFLLARLTRWRLRAWQRLGWTSEHTESGVGIDYACNFALGDLAAVPLSAGGGGVAPESASRRQLVERAAVAAQRGRPTLARMKAAAARGASKREREQNGVPMRAYLSGLSVRGGQVPVVVTKFEYSCGRKPRAKKGAHKRAYEARARGIANGRLPDSRGAWEVEGVIDVRRREGTRNAIDALIRWVSPDPAAPYDDSWEPVNAVAIPDAALRAGAKAMWAARRQGDAPPATEAAAAVEDEACATAARPDGESWRGSLRTRAPPPAPKAQKRAAAAAVTTRLERDVDLDEEDVLHRMETGARETEAAAATSGAVATSGGAEAVTVAGSGNAAASGGQSSGSLQGVPQCGFCKLALGPLREHVHCVECVLGLADSSWTGEESEGVAALCATPSLLALERVLSEVDVRGDGSCWVYAALAWTGRAAHAVDDAGRPRLGAAPPPAWRDRVADRVLRTTLGAWMRTNAWVKRFGDRKEAVQVVNRRRRTVYLEPTAKEAEATVRGVESNLPIYAPGGWELVTSGSWGGDIHFVALACVLNRAVATYSAVARRGSSPYAIALAMPGVSRDGGAGRTETTSVEGALRACLKDKVAMSLAVNVHGNHWHALLPCSAGGAVRPVSVPSALAAALDGTQAEEAARWLQRHAVQA
jgi:ribonuclease HI